MPTVIAALDIVLREALLFAAIGFLIGGIDDMLVDLLFWGRAARRWVTGHDDRAPRLLSDLPARADAGRIAVFVAAWDEAAVIGAMLTSALARIDYRDYRIYVGTYPNDPATIAAVAEIAERDDRVRLVIGSDPGPTTKAACLNTVWRALERDEAAQGGRARAIVLHDAEDMVHPAELTVFDHLIDTHWAVQLPVLPIVDQGSRLVSGSYIDEFAESHAKQMIVRQSLGAGLPLAGVGCALAREALEAVASARGGAPFDADSLTEDYELGLAIAALGGRAVLARVREYRGGPLVAVHAYFPATLDAAVRQKARWMIGIALAGWDRVGWARWSHWRDHWMRMRDRWAPLAVLILAAAYVALVSWGLVGALRWLTGTPWAPLAVPDWLLAVNAGLLGWRLLMRVLFTGRGYGWREALWAVPRVFVANLIALLAARRAILRYILMLRGKRLVWDKTVHRFPADPLAAGRTR